MRRILLIEADRGINEANQTALELEGYALRSLAVDKPYPMNEALCLLISTSGSTGSPKLV